MVWESRVARPSDSVAVEPVTFHNVVFAHLVAYQGILQARAFL